MRHVLSLPSKSTEWVYRAVVAFFREISCISCTLYIWFREQRRWIQTTWGMSRQSVYNRALIRDQCLTPGRSADIWTWRIHDSANIGFKRFSTDRMLGPLLTTHTPCVFETHTHSCCFVTRTLTHTPWFYVSFFLRDRAGWWCKIHFPIVKGWDTVFKFILLNSKIFRTTFFKTC